MGPNLIVTSLQSYNIPLPTCIAFHVVCGVNYQTNLWLESTQYFQKTCMQDYPTVLFLCWSQCEEKIHLQNSTLTRNDCSVPPTNFLIFQYTRFSLELYSDACPMVPIPRSHDTLQNMQTKQTKLANF